MEAYKNKIQKLQDIVKNSEQVRMYKKSMTNTFREKDITPNNKRLDLSDFNNVIHINTNELYVDVEGSTTFETLVDETLQYNLMPAVTPELKTITIGGAIVGLGIESSSFRYGLVHDNVLELDVILSSGEILTCNKNTNSDLFNAIPNSLGSLCYITRVRMQLIPVKKYVHINKQWYDSYVKLCRDVEASYKDKYIDFIDGVVFSKNQCVLIKGIMVDDIGNKTTSDYKTENIYYKSLLPKAGNKTSDFLTIKDYIWRWDSDWFWCNTSIPFIENSYVRKYILGEKYLRSDVYKWLLYKLSGFLDLMGYTKNKESVVQDVIIPIENVPKYLDFLYEKVLIGNNSRHYVWLCPHLNHSSTLVPGMDDKLYIDVAQWGLFDSDNIDPFYFNKLIERYCFELNGVKSLYSTVHYDRETFNKLYNGTEYEKLKKKYDPDNKIRNMYEKCTTK